MYSRVTGVTLVLVGYDLRLYRCHSRLLSLSLLLLFVQLFDCLDLLFQFHSPVLEPDLYLSFCQAQGVRHFDSPPSCQIVVGVEFFFQLQRLVAGVCLSASSSQTIGTCERENKVNYYNKIIFYTNLKYFGNI